MGTQSQPPLLHIKLYALLYWLCYYMHTAITLSSHVFLGWRDALGCCCPLHVMLWRDRSLQIRFEITACKPNTKKRV